MALVVALDIGGTFTDLVAFDLDSGRITESKSSTTPYDLSVGIRKTLEKSGLPISQLDTFVHGSTVAINTAIERTGAKTALIVTQGTRDVYQIGRGNRPESYNFFFKRAEPYVHRRHTYEIVERLSAAGDVLVALDLASAATAVQNVKAQQAEAVAVCCLHSWANPDHEARIGEVLDREFPGAFRSLSHDILREYREYERTSTTVLNAYVGPRVSRYLADLERLLTELGFEGRLLIMQSNGGTMSPATAMRLPIATMESGPVGGIIAGAEVMRDIDISNVIAFDMGGTTAKVSLVRQSEPTIAQGYFVGGEASGHPVMYPVVDIVEVGAGGGSIAWIDEVGGLKVGPRSAGGHPGPVCYGQGGTEPTVTDANLVLAGGIVAPADGFLSGLRSLCDETGTLLMIDETHTLSAGPGGCTAAWGLDPDIVTMGKAIAGGIPIGAFGLRAELAERILALVSEQDADIVDVGGIGGTLAGNALSMAAARATLEYVLTDEAFARMDALSVRLTQQVEASIDRHGVPWSVTRLGARSEYRFCSPAPVNGTESHLANDPDLDEYLHLFMSNRGVLITPFHNMVLMCPDTTEADVDLHGVLFDQAVALLVG